MFAQAKLSLQTGAIDVCEPTVDRIGGWASNGLVQGWDTSKLALDNYLPGLADGQMGEMATIDGKRMIVMSVWGTEAIVYSKTEAPTEYGKASLGDLFDPKFEGKVCLRPHSTLAAMGRWLDVAGQAAEALDRRLQGRSRHEGAVGHRARRGDQGTRPTSPSSGAARTRPRPPTAPTAPSSA